MDLNPFSISAVQGPKSVVLKNDYLIELGGRNSDTGELLVDCIGPKAVLMSDLLENLPSDVLAQFVNETAARMVLISKGLS